MELTLSDDRILIERAQAGVTEAFRTLVERYMKRVYAVAFDMTGDHHEAEDVSQEVFLRLFQALGRFRGEARIGTWLYRTTVNACIDRNRKKAWRILRGRGLDDEDDAIHGRPEHASALSQPETEAEKVLVQQQIWKAMDSLGPRARAVFVLRHYHARSTKEIAECLQVTEGTVKSTLFKAIRQLRTRLNCDEHQL